MTDPIKILHVVHSLEPGGLENGIVNLSRRLDPSAFETHIFCLEQKGKFSSRLADPENIFACGKAPGFSLKAAGVLQKRILKLNPHVVHSHNLGPLIYASLATLMGRIRPLLHGEHSELTKEEQKPRRMFQRRCFYKACAKIHTVSDSLKAHLIDLGFPGSKLVSIPNGVDTDRFSPAQDRRDRLRNTLGISQRAIVLGIVGRFGAHKRHSVLIDAFLTIAGSEPDLHLLIVGSGGPLQETVRNQASGSAVAERIHLVGFQDRTEDYYKCMDLLVAPSVNEGLSNAVLEAMACEIPVLSHFSCGSAEAITDGRDGYVADLSDTELLTKKLTEILPGCEAWPEMGSRARMNIQERFSMDSMAERYGDLYRALAGQARQGSMRLQATLKTS